MEPLNNIDVIILICVATSMLVAFVRGFVKEVLSILPKTLRRNLEKALSTYKKYNEVDEDKMDDILDTCDDVFYENEEGINIILEKYAGTIEL